MPGLLQGSGGRHDDLMRGGEQLQSIDATQRVAVLTDFVFEDGAREEKQFAC
jgi:hypothetical protein